MEPIALRLYVFEFIVGRRSEEYFPAFEGLGEDWRS